MPRELIHHPGLPLLHVLLCRTAGSPPVPAADQLPWSQGWTWMERPLPRPSVPTPSTGPPAQEQGALAVPSQGQGARAGDWPKGCRWSTEPRWSSDHGHDDLLALGPCWLPLPWTCSGGTAQVQGPLPRGRLGAADAPSPSLWRALCWPHPGCPQPSPADVTASLPRGPSLTQVYRERLLFIIKALVPTGGRGLEHQWQRKGLSPGVGLRGAMATPPELELRCRPRPGGPGGAGGSPGSAW